MKTDIFDKEVPRLVLPHDILRGENRSVSMYEIIGGFIGEDKSYSIFDTDNRSGGYAEHFPWILGYRIPPFQRDLCWTTEQKVKFIESMFLGYDLGKMAYVIGYQDRFDGCIIDGLQRLSAIKSYLEGEFSVFGRKFMELNFYDMVILRNIDIPAVGLRNMNEYQLRELYNRLNFGGTAHKEHERA